MIFKIHLIIFLIFSLCFGDNNIKPDKLIMYKKIGDTELHLHAFYPPKNLEENLYPAIIFFFGGGWNSENKTQFYRQSKYFSSLGIACFCADYRVRSIHNVSPDKCVMDAKSAIRFIRENNITLDIDSDKIIASGGSAGGHLAASTATLPLFDDHEDNLEISAVPNALILFNPVLNTSNINRLGDLSINLSPYHHLSSKIPPTLIMHGTNDKIVNHYQAVEFYEKMRDLKNICKIKLYEKMPHGFFNNIKYNETLEEVESFIRSLHWIE